MVGFDGILMGFWDGIRWDFRWDFLWDLMGDVAEWRILQGDFSMWRRVAPVNPSHPSCSSDGNFQGPIEFDAIDLQNPAPRYVEFHGIMLVPTPAKGFRVFGISLRAMIPESPKISPACLGSSAMAIVCYKYIPDAPWCGNIYLQNWAIFRAICWGKCVGINIPAPWFASGYWELQFTIFNMYCIIFYWFII